MLKNFIQFFQQFLKFEKKFGKKSHYLISTIVNDELLNYLLGYMNLKDIIF